MTPLARDPSRYPLPQPVTGPQSPRPGAASQPPQEPPPQLTAPPPPGPLYPPQPRYTAPVLSRLGFSLRPRPPRAPPVPPRSPGTGTWRRRRPPPAGSAPPEQAPLPAAHARPRAQPHDVTARHRPASRPPARGGGGAKAGRAQRRPRPLREGFLKGQRRFFFFPRAAVTAVCPPPQCHPSVTLSTGDVAPSTAPAVSAQPCPELCPIRSRVPLPCPLSPAVSPQL